MTWNAHFFDTVDSVPCTRQPYAAFIHTKTHSVLEHGFTPYNLPSTLYDFQAHLTDWACRTGRAAIFADCGLGKTAMQLAWGHQVLRQTNKPILLLTPLAVGPQTVREGLKFDLPCQLARNGQVTGPAIYVANYERLHYFDASLLGGVICDESSILKHFSGVTQKQVTRFLAKVPYRLLCSATPAPNDYTELGTSSEALGGLGYSEMITRFFVLDDKKRSRMNDVKLARQANTGSHYAKLAYRVSQRIGQWRMKGHADRPFWQWVCSWARACRHPSDLGFSDEGFVLPFLQERAHIVEPYTPPDGMLFTLDAFGLREEREERKRTLGERCEQIVKLVAPHDRSVIWCHFNTEGDLLHRLMPDAVQVKGSMSDDAKLEAYEAFTSGQAARMITKPVIGAWGLNWQHCAHVATFASHSYEQYYQSIRRCWRFGQTRPVIVDVVCSKGEAHILDNLQHKQRAAERMFAALVEHMADAQRAGRAHHSPTIEVPSWLHTS